MIKINDYKKVNKQELLNILNVNKEALKKIEQKQQLKERLFDKGYIFKDKIKEGRKVYYIIKQTSSKKEVYNNMCDLLFNTKDDELFSDYFLYRILNLEKAITKEYIADNCNVNRNMITKFDKKMVEHNILNKDGYFYIACDIDNDKNKTYRITVKEEYNYYMKCSRGANKKKTIAQDYKNDRIDYDTMIMLLDAIDTYMETIEKKFVYRVNKFLLIKENELYKDIYKMIEELYKEKAEDNKYYLSWLQSIKNLK